MNSFIKYTYKRLNDNLLVRIILPSTLRTSYLNSKKCENYYKRHFSVSRGEFCRSEQESEYERKTHFGNETVSMKEKAEKVHGVFQNVAPSYDLMNDLMSVGVHRLWKDYFVYRIDPRCNMKFLDVAGGTGDISFRILRSIHSHLAEDPISEFGTNKADPLLEPNDEFFPQSPQSHSLEPKVTVCDISEEMLSVGKKRSEIMGPSFQGEIEWVFGDAENLPFEDESFDVYTIAFGIRNVPDYNQALREAFRVLKIGGRFTCLEFSQVPQPLIRRLYDLYSSEVIPLIGQIVAGDWKSYQYLVESIRKFPDQETFKMNIEEAGFRKVSYENLTFGVVAIHTGFKV